MADEPAPAFIRWNSFARELEPILARRNLRLGHLDDRKDEQGPLVHPEKVRRLQRSLDTPKSLTTLNPDELRRVTHAFNLTPEEEARLRAALLATAAERLLLGRVDQYIALQAADEAFYTLLAAIGQDPPPPGMSGVRDPAASQPYVIVPATDDSEPLAQAMGAIDRATLALHLSEDQAPISERIDRAAEAQMDYTRALDTLGQMPTANVDHEAWAYWRDEALHWKGFASQQLRALLAIPQSDA
jgi:hypothetical protein